MPDTARGSSVGHNSIFLSVPSLLVPSLAALPLALWLSHTSHLPCSRTRQSGFPCLVFALAAAPIWNSLPLLFVQLLVAETSSAPTWVSPLLPSPSAPSPQSTASAGLLAVGQGQGTNWGHRAVSRGEGSHFLTAGLYSQITQSPHGGQQPLGVGSSAGHCLVKNLISIVLNL